MLDRAGPILDIGAGDSPFGRERLDVVRVDPAYADEPPAGSRAVAALGQALPFADRTFSVVLGSFVAQHVRDVDELLTELLRVVRPEGLLALHPVWRPPAGRRAVGELNGHARLLSSADIRASWYGDLRPPPRRTRWRTLPSLVLRRPPHGTPRELGRIAETIAQSRALVPPAVIAVPAHWGVVSRGGLGMPSVPLRRRAELDWQAVGRIAPGQGRWRIALRFRVRNISWCYSEV
ncbi:methyltransferase domain-containing protein [Streptomyces sp. NPDC002143]